MSGTPTLHKMPVYKRDVTSLAKSGSAKLKGDITLSEGTNVTLTQSGQDIEIAAAGIGGGDVTKVGTPANNQMAVWTGDGTLEGTSDFTYDGTSLNLITGKNFQIAGSTILADSTGTTTLSNIDALDATTESTIEAAIDTLANLTSIQGRTVTLADAGANAIFGWDDTAGAYENLTQSEARTVLGLGTAAYVATDLSDLNEATIESAIDTLANLTSVQGKTLTLAGALITSGANSLTLTTTGATNVTLPTTGTLQTKRYVAIDAVEVLNTDPGVSTFADLDVTSSTSSTAYAVVCSAAILPGATIRELAVRTNGSSATAAVSVVLRGTAGSVSAKGCFTVGCDSGQIFEWAASNADVTNVTINVIGYWETVA